MTLNLLDYSGHCGQEQLKVLTQVTLQERWGTTLVGFLMGTQDQPLSVLFTLRLEVQRPALPACFLERPSTAPVMWDPGGTLLWRHTLLL